MVLRAHENNLTNLIVKEAAIDLESGWRTLQISDAFSKGTSSLLEFSKPKNLERYWEIRPDSRQHRQIEVRTVTLEKLIDEVLEEYIDDFRQEIEIDFLKIDVQGKDYDALLSIGKYLKNVKAGMLEAPILSSDSIYSDQDKSIMDYFIKLRELDFSVYQLKPNDPEFKEFNIYFNQTSLDASKLIESLKLDENEIYFGNVNPVIDTLRVIDSYKNSLSWRITHPLRLLKQVFSNVGK